MDAHPSYRRYGDRCAHRNAHFRSGADRLHREESHQPGIRHPSTGDRRTAQLPGTTQLQTVMRTNGIVPARYASTRLPGKPLVDIGGMSMVQRVVEQARRSRSLERVIVATDDDRIVEHVKAFGGEAVLTSPDHRSGTDRCFEALKIADADKYDAVVNIQGDEPFIDPAQIDLLCATLHSALGGIATLAQVVNNDADLGDAGEVLIVTDV